MLLRENPGPTPQANTLVCVGSQYATPGCFESHPSPFFLRTEEASGFAVTRLLCQAHPSDTCADRWRPRVPHLELAGSSSRLRTPLLQGLSAGSLLAFPLVIAWCHPAVTAPSMPLLCQATSRERCPVCLFSSRAKANTSVSGTPRGPKELGIWTPVNHDAGTWRDDPVHPETPPPTSYQPVRHF